MAQVSVNPTAINAASNSSNLVAQLVKMVNAQAAAINALTAKLDLDAGVTDDDYATTVGTMDTLVYSVGTTPS